MNDKINELLALVGKWRGRGKREREDAGYPGDTAHDDCADELAPIATALCAEVEALRKDAERLDWLQRAARTSTVHMGGQHPWNLTGNHKLHNLRGPDLRAAIDAAKEPK